MFCVINNHQEVDRNKWSEFVAEHPFGNIFHTPEIFDLHNDADRYEPLFFAVLSDEKKILGLLIAVIHREYKGFIGKYTARAIIWGGPLAIGQDTEIADLLLKEYDIICQKKVIYSQFRNLWDISCFKATFDQKGYIYEEHLDFIFDLDKGEEVLWNNIHPTRRKQINRGIKRGIQTKVSVINNIDVLEKCYYILHCTYKIVKLPVPDIKFFQRAVQILGNQGYLKAILATFHDEIVGFRFFLCYQGLLYDWYAGSMTEHHDKYPNDVLPWELMKWGIAKGFKTFDFGGAGKPGVPYGVRDYKIKFGGDMVNFGRYEKIHKPFIMMLARIGFRIWKLFNK